MRSKRLWRPLTGVLVAYAVAARRWSGIRHGAIPFRQINLEQPNVHHDALEFPDGQVVKLTQLCEGQHATVLQLPASPRATNEAEQQKRGSLVT